MGPPTPQEGGGVEWISGGLGMMWGPSRWCGDDRNDTGTTWEWWGWRGDHGDHGDNMGWRQQRPQVMGTTWGPSGGYGDDVEMMGEWRGWHRDDVRTTGMMWGPRGLQGPRGQHGVETTETMEETTETTAMGTTWGPSGGYGDNVGMTGTTWGQWGQCGDHGDNKITKNAITFERIEIIEFRLKIWDPWTLPHTCTLQLMWRWGGVLSQIAFLSKKCSGVPQKKFFSCFSTGSH